MCESRKRFRRQLKAWKREGTGDFCDRLDDDLKKGDCKSFWQNVKFGQRSCRAPPTMRVGQETSDYEYVETAFWWDHQQ